MMQRGFLRLVASLWGVSLLLVLNDSTAEAQTKSGPEAFSYLHQVATNPRCVNCHGQVIDGEHRPTVGNEMKRHPMNITARFESLGHKCITCHGIRNLDVEGAPPGAANDLLPDFFWHMPPQGMILRADMSQRELCEVWTDPERNNNRGSLSDLERLREQFIEHIEKDPLIHWTFDPGGDRTPSPGSLEQLRADMETWLNWLAAGNTCNNL